MEDQTNAIPHVAQSATYMSEKIDLLTAALSAFQGEISQPKLNKEVSVTTKAGRQYKFKYADLAECVKSAAPMLAKHGLAVTQIMLANGYLVTLLSHKSGQWIKSVVALAYEKLDGFQALGSAITYLKRYSYCAILGIVADADDDGNMADGNSAEIKDRKAKGAAVAYTGEQLQNAIDEMNAAADEHEFTDIWSKWAQTCPALCANGTEFYKAACKKRQSLNEAAK